MTASPHEQDELASAYIDGEVTAEERALVETDPRLLARVEELKAARDALAVPVDPPSETARDLAIRAAVGAANVIDLSVARTRRRLRIASIAAAIVLAVGAAGLLIRSSDHQSADKFQTAAGSVSSSATGQAPERTPQGATAAAGAAESLATSARPALGSFHDRAALAEATRTQVLSLRSADAKQANPAPGTAAAADSGAASTCGVAAPADSANEVYAATAVLEGRGVQIDVFSRADGSLTLVVTDTASCAVLFTQPV